MDPELEEQFVEDVTPGAEGAEVTTTDEPKNAPVSQASLDAAFEKLSSTLSTSLQPKKDEPQMSEEEQQKLWAIYNPESTQKDFMRKFFRLNPEATKEEEQEARSMFKSMQEGLVRQSIVGARNLFQAELQKMREEYAPLVSHHRDVIAKELQSAFFKAYPSLGEQDEASGSYRYMTAVRLAAQELANQTFATQPLYFKALAEKAAGIVSGIVPGFVLGDSKTKTKSSTNTPRLPRTSAGGTGGTARGGEDRGDGKAVRGSNGDDAATLDWVS
jgi:hypothetical protein